MAWITFTENVTLEYEDGEGPHYRAGYCVDVKGRVARSMIDKGVAVAGQVTIVSADDTDEPDAQDAATDDNSEAVEAPTFRRGRRRR